MATADGTKQFCDRMVSRGKNPTAYAELGRTGLMVSGVGFGCYRVHDSVDSHTEALHLAIEGGCNLIDTSTNYGDGGSERLVGSVLDNLSPEWSSDEIVVVSKVGYLQGQNLADALGMARRDEGYEEVVRYAEGCWHCIHPRFIRDQLNKSLGRLRQPSLDVYLLHNPEYFLSHLDNEGDERTLEERRDVFYERIARAFECMEELVEAGQIGWYGVSSNTFVVPSYHPDATSAERMLGIAEEVCGKDHHFAVFQLPMNLLETGAVYPQANGAERPTSVLELASASQVGVLVNRPLNAICEGELIRLTDFEIDEPDQPVAKLAKALARLETEFDEGLARALRMQTEAPVTDHTFRWSTQATNAAKQLHDIVKWDQYVQSVFNPALSRQVGAIEHALSGPLQAAWHLWLERYIDSVSVLLMGLRAKCARASQRRSDKLAKRIAPHLPEELRDTPLSQQVISLLRGCTGVSSVLVGMRSVAYVSDATSVLDRPVVSVASDAVHAIFKDGVP
jgi:aryl-alcohol dehydrogenase-like predicted oxidoreductase